MRLIRELWRSEDGLATVEYALLMMLIVLVTATAFATLGSRTSRMVTTP